MRILRDSRELQTFSTVQAITIITRVSRQQIGSKDRVTTLLNAIESVPGFAMCFP